MFRKVLPVSIAKDIVGVQPMSANSSSVFTLRPRYSSNKYNRWTNQQCSKIKKWFNYQYIYVKSIITYYRGLDT